MNIKKLNEACTLQDLTRQESGLVIYRNNGHYENVLVANWAYMNDYELPVVSSFSAYLLGWSYGKWTVDNVRDVDDIRDELPGTIDIIKNDDGTLSAHCTMNILFDYNGEIPKLYGIDIESGAFSQPEPVSGRCYHLSFPGGMDVKVIAPKNWG